MIKIYGLSDPNSPQMIKFIGGTSFSLKDKRILEPEHTGNHHRKKWLMELRKNGIEPKVKLLKISKGGNYFTDLKETIIKYWLEDHKLLNHLVWLRYEQQEES